MIAVSSPVVRHPAKYSDCLLPLFAELLRGYGRVLDPFGGTGKLKQVRPDAICLELEREWSQLAGGVRGDALSLPFADKCFDAVCTSPCYGNRLADHHAARDASRRNSYTFALGRQLHCHNAGRLQWGPEYQAFHRAGWREVQRVLRRGGRLVLNVSDHIRRGESVPVTLWHEKQLFSLGFELENCLDVPTPRLKFGANAELRPPFESVLVWRLTRG